MSAWSSSPSHDYVRTSISSQGRTTDVVLVSESTDSFPAADRRQMYTTASRGRFAIRVYTDDTEALLKAADRDRQKANALDLVTPVKDRARFVNRIKQAVVKAKEQVIQLTKPKEIDYELG